MQKHWTKAVSEGAAQIAAKERPDGRRLALRNVAGQFRWEVQARSPAGWRDVRNASTFYSLAGAISASDWKSWNVAQCLANCAMQAAGELLAQALPEWLAVCDVPQAEKTGVVLAFAKEPARRPVALKSRKKERGGTWHKGQRLSWITRPEKRGAVGCVA